MTSTASSHKKYNKEAGLKNTDLLKFSPLYKVWTQKIGVNSSILLHHHYKDNSYKVVARYGAEKGGFEFKEAQEMIQNIIDYQKELKVYSVPLPHIEDIFVEFHPLKKRAVITKISQWTGNDVEKIIENCDIKKNKQYLRKIIKDMFKIIRLLCADRFSGWETRVGIDPRPSNFTIDKDGHMWFVDLFPPRYRKQNQPIVEWPAPKSKLGQKLGYFKHFDVRGIILCMLSQLAKIKPDMKQIFEGIIIEESQVIMNNKEHQEFIKVLKESPWQKLRNTMNTKPSFNNQYQEEAEHLITTSLDREIFDIDYSIYTLREMALEFACRGCVSKKELGDFFRKSHFEDKLPQERIIKLQKELCGFFRRDLI